MLSELPTEVLLGVARFLHADSVCRLRGVCRRLRDVLDDDRLFGHLARFYERHGFAALFGFDVAADADLVFRAASRSEFVFNMTCFRKAYAPVFCFFFSRTELCFGNCLSGEMFVVPSHLTPPAHASLDWVENGKKRDCAAASSAISLLFALAKEHRRFGVCALVESSCFDRESFGRRDAFPQLSFQFESLPLLLGGFFPDCCVLILEDDRAHGWGVVNGAVGLKISPPAAERSATSAAELRRHVSGLKRNDCPLREKHTVLAEDLLVQFARKHSDKRVVLIGGHTERLKHELSIARHEPQIFHCVFRALVAKAASVKYGKPM